MITAYRKQNNLEDLEMLSEVLENYWCGLPENKGRCEPRELKRGVLGYLKGGIAVLKNMVYAKFAPQEIADSRGRQCVECKFNTFKDNGPFVEWSNKIAEASTLGRKSKYHDKLGECAVCICPLRAKVFYGDVISLEQEWIEPMQSVNCWQLKAGRVVKK